jgi:signal transduction histidine kinase
MRERVQALGGDFAIETGPGRGTRLRIVLPLPSRPDSSAESADYASSAP